MKMYENETFTRQLTKTNPKLLQTQPQTKTNDDSDSDFSDTYESISIAPMPKLNRTASMINRAKSDINIYQDVRLLKTTTFTVYGLILLHFVLFCILIFTRTSFPITKSRDNVTVTRDIARIEAISLIFAKNSAVLTVVATYICLFIAKYVLNREDCLSISVHRAAAYLILIFSLIHTISHIVRYFAVIRSVYTFNELMNSVLFLKYLTGIFMLVFLLLLILTSTNFIRKYHFNLFYYIHLVSVIGFLVSSCLHSIWFVPIVLYWLLTIPMHRFLCRIFVKCTLLVEMYSSDFVLIDLKIKRTWLAKLLLLNTLEHNNGNSDIWMICKNISYLERHPFTVIETNHRGDHDYVRVMFSKFGDWKMQLATLLETNKPYNLYSCGASILVDTAHISMSFGPWKSKYLLFLMNNVEYTTFLAFITHLCDKRNDKVRKIVRHIYLHYSFSHYDYYRVLVKHLDRTKLFNSIHINVTVYTSLDITENELIDSIQVVKNSTCRLPYRQAIDKFYSCNVSDTGSRAIVVTNSLLRAKVLKHLVDAQNQSKTHKRKIVEVV